MTGSTTAGASGAQGTDVRHRVLIVEDELHLAEGLRFNLEAEGYEVDVVDTGEAALAKLLGGGDRRFDLVVLDVMLPGKDGFAVVSELRGAKQFVPVLILTARGRPEDVLKGFSAGADDYLPKPTELAILLARIRGLLRRTQWLRRPADRYTFAGRTIDFDTRELRVGERTLPLTLMEASLLRYLIEHPGVAVSRKAMLEDVWGLREDTDTRAIDNFMVRLRRYIEQDPSRPRHLLTVRGVGYRFVAEPGGGPDQEDRAP
jgi:DNA-binding response OmpR family regulator